MPHALIALPDVYESVVQRVSLDAVTQLVRIMRLPPETTIRIPGYAGTIAMNDGFFKECGATGLHYPTDGHIVVEVLQETSEEHTLITPVNTKEHQPVFLDAHRGISIRPVYRYIKMTLNLTYHAPNHNLALRWLDEMRARVSMLRAELYQTLEYHYAIPDPVMVLLNHLHETKEASSVPTGDSFKTYLDEHLLRPTTTIETLVGTHPSRAIKEKQYEVLGWFDFTDSPPTPEKDGNESGAFLCTVGYNLNYNRPTQLYCRWPMVVHNQPIGRLYRPQEPYETFRQHSRRVTLTKGSIESLLANMRFHGIPYVQHPDVDDWVPARPATDTLTFFTGLLVIDPEKPRRLLDLFNLGPFTFTPYFLEYFYQQRHSLFNDRYSPFTFRLYQNERFMSEVSLSFEDGGVTLQADQDLDLTQYYHLQIGIKRNWITLHPDAVACLRRYPTVTYLTLLALGVVLGGYTLDRLNLLGEGVKRPVSAQCPGEGSLLDPPVAGGTWPWPWLGDEWTDTPYPGYDWDESHPENTWPGGGHPDILPVNPTWPGVKPPETIEDGSTGVIRDKDIQDAIQETANQVGWPIDGEVVGPLNVLYLEILSSLRS